ncbi:MAG: dTDP-4-dehydrorhamnose 3,5-epimerase [Cyanobium sp.]
MQVETTALAGVLLLTPEVFGDPRGYFLESWNRRRFAAALGLAETQLPEFVQDNQSRSSRGVLRGLHFQVAPEAQAKLVRCVAGEIFDVAVDLRQGSATFGQWTGALLSGSNHRQLWVPVGFAHGFLTLSESAEVLYKTAGYWSRSCERSLRWNDPELAIAWPSADGAPEPLLTTKDAEAPTLAELVARGDVFGAAAA